MAPAPRILFIVTEDWLFVLFRMALAGELLRRGYQVSVACAITGQEQTIEQAGVKVFPVPFARAGVSPVAFARAALAIRRVLRQVRPDLVQAVALQAILTGWGGTIGLRRPPFVNLVTGLGSMFTPGSRGWRLRAAGVVAKGLFRRALHRPGAHSVFQNQADFDLFVTQGFSSREASHLIHGSGVEVSQWEPRPETSAQAPVVLFVGRLLRDKGVEELLAASSLLRSRKIDHVLRLVGICDPRNPTSLKEAEVQARQARGECEWLGWRTDVLAQMNAAHVVALPSYREGLPKVLLEAGVAQRAVVACDVAGCRDVVAHGVNGLLVPPGNAPALADALERLLRNSELRGELARAHRERVLREFAMPLINQQFIDLYERILRGAGGVAHPASTQAADPQFPAPRG